MNNKERKIRKLGKLIDTIKKDLEYLNIVKVKSIEVSFFSSNNNQIELIVEGGADYTVITHNFTDEELFEDMNYIVTNVIYKVGEKEDELLKSYFK